MISIVVEAFKIVAKEQGKETRLLGDKRKNQDLPDHSSVKTSLHTWKGPEDLRWLAVT